MKLFLVLGFLSLSAGLVAKDLNYDQVDALATKTVVDYFLLCPDIVPVVDDRGETANFQLGDPDDRSLAQVKNDLGFRRRLLSPGRVGPGVTVKSVTVDLRNAYLKIDGTRTGRPFSLVFVYFENAKKQRIPALTFHAEASGDTEDSLRLYDLEADFWQALPRSQVLPEFSTQPLAPYIGTGDDSDVAWVAELPRYGTTVRFLPQKAGYFYEESSDEAQAYLRKVIGYALECSWNKALARFDAPRAALADKGVIPRGTPSAADYYALRNPGDPEARMARDLWTAQNPKLPRYFEHRGNDSEGTRFRILGHYHGLPLVAELRWVQDNTELMLWLYHADSGLMEPSGLSVQSGVDFAEFYAAQNKAEGAQGQRLGLQYALALRRPGILVRLDPSHGAENLDPDFHLYFEWDDGKSVFVKTAEGTGETP